MSNANNYVLSLVTEHMDKTPGYFMGRYEGKPEFEESFFRIS
jgi:hypothetical protein